MPKRSKKVDTGKKKPTTGKKNNTTGSKSSDMDLNDSFLTPSGCTIVSTVSSPQQPPRSDPVAENGTVLAYLQKIDTTNQMLLRRVDELESQRVTPTTTQATNVTLGQAPTNIPVGTASVHSAGHQYSAATSTSSQAGPSQTVTSNTGLLGHAVHPAHSSQLHDAVVPDVNAIRNNPTISQSVSHILSSLEATSRAEVLQGKVTHKKSGRFNTTDTVTAIPELRWPNEGYHGIGGRKRTLYDDLTIQEWAVGQLTNIYHIQDPVLAKQVLLQVILSLRDATSLPWQAVRGAWGNSMHEIEQGSLQWSDATQWALNRLSTSQIAMATASQISSLPTTQKKVCRYYNDGVCSHEGNHGQFKHVCSFCAKQGKNYNHPETKCQVKLRGVDRNQNINK